MSLNRKRFLQQMAIIAAGAALPMDAMAKTLQSASNSGNKKSQERVDLLVLHTNDLHSRIEPFPANHPMAGKGGIANLATLIQQHRKQHPHVLLLDCGDVFQGTPYFNLFGGAVEYQWMQNMGYHATTMGNHDFDNGIEHLANMLEKNPGVGMLNCNYQLHNTPLKDLVQPHKIIQIAHKKIGITAVGISPENLILERMIPGLVYQDPVTQVQKTVDYLRNEAHCDAVFVISHLGYSYDTSKIDDLKLAAQTQRVLMVGHVFEYNPAVHYIKRAMDAGEKFTWGQVKQARAERRKASDG